MNNLLDRGLIEAKGRLDAPGRPMLYGTTKDFLRCFGLKDLSDLPETTDELIKAFGNAKASEDDMFDAEQITIEDQSLNTETEALTEENTFDIDDPSADESSVNDI